MSNEKTKKMGQLVEMALELSFAGDDAGALAICEGLGDEQVQLQHEGDGVFLIVGTDYRFVIPEAAHLEVAE